MRHGAWLSWSLLALAACGRSGPPLEDGTPVPGAPGVVSLEQGWDADTQMRAWYTSFGSRLMPYEWFGALEQADSEARFNDNGHMAQLGFLPQAAQTLNPGGYPVGFARVLDSKGNAWVGLTCAACHTGEIHYRGAKLRIDGGAGLLDFTAFDRAVLAALSATVAQGAKFKRFADALKVPDGERLKLQNRMVALAQKYDARGRMNQTEVSYGHGRLDAFGQIFNAVTTEFLGMPDNRRAPDAPVSYPIMWSASHLDLVQWNGSAPNAGPGPLFQNVTTALAVYGNMDLIEPRRLGAYRSTVNFDGLGRLQDWMYQLKPPRWPGKYFGELDEERATRGAALYAEHCQSCHALSNRDEAKRKLTVTLTPIADVGTDPRAATNFLNARASTGPLQGRKQAVVAGPVFGTEASAIDMVIHATIGVVLRHPLKAVREAVVGYHSVIKAAIDQHPNYYKARPLDGVWASAPYLHNGSVPTLADVLEPPAARPARFYVGSREFNPERVGYVDEEGPHTSLFDTALSGNSNAGHTYGTDLDADAKRDLLEYLKSL
jgi:cytochrome c5